MIDPIIFSPPSGNQYESNSVSSQNWIISPPEVYVYWLMNSVFPSTIPVRFSFPDYESIPQYEDHTDWSFQATSSHQLVSTGLNPSIPFTQVNGEDSYSGTLGTLVSGIYNKVLDFSFFNLNLLSEGQYIVTTTVKIVATNPFTLLPETISEKKYYIVFYANSLSFLAAPPFELAYAGKGTTFFDLLIGTTDYTPLIFNYYQTGSLPPAVEVYYFGLPNQNTAPPSALEISDPELQAVYTGVHPYFSKLIVDFSSAITSKPLGTYNYTLGVGYYGSGDVVDLIKQVPIVLNVLPEVVSDISITPESLTFDVTLGGSQPVGQTVSLFSAIPWEVISDLPSWLSVSQLSGQGNATLLFLPVNFNSLVDGEYVHEMVFSNGTDEVTLTIILNITVFLQNPFLPGKLHFTKDIAGLNFISQNSGIYVELTVTTRIFKNQTYEEVVYTRVYSIPLADKKGFFHLGSVIHDLFDEIQHFSDFVTDFSANYFSAGYKPAVIDIAYEEKQFIATEVVPELISGSMEGIMFIKGIQPFITQNQLSLLTVQQQFLSRISKNSVIGLNFTYSGNPTLVVKRNNIVIETLTLIAFGSGRFIYNYYRFINDFNIGDLIELFVTDGNDSRCHRYLVHHEGIDSTLFFFENQHGVFEPFELIGRRRVSSNYKHTLNSKYKNLFSFDEKIITQNAQSFVVNPGTLHPEDHKILDALIKSEKVWCSFSGPAGNYVRVNATTSKAAVSDTLSNNFDFDIEFNILENSNDIFCF